MLSQIYSCTESLTKLKKQSNMKRMKKKKMRADLVQELKTLLVMMLLHLHRTVVKFGVRNRLMVIKMTTVAEKSGLKVIHRINIFEEIIFILY